MKVIIVCSGTKGEISPFIQDQMESLTKLGGIEFLLFQIKKKGLLGYLLHLTSLLKSIKQFKPDMIHAHYGLSGLLANLQRRVPVLTTFHGSDVNNKNILKWSKWAHRLSAASIFVEESMMEKFKRHHKSYIIPCGVDLETFFPIPKPEAQENLGLQRKSLNILFSSDFGNPVKNYPLARKACDIVEEKTGEKINLIEMKGLSRPLVNLFMNASDCALLFSFSEGSPQFIKEAMACNCPIVATDVGDIKWIVGNIEGCFISSSSVDDVADKVIYAMNYSKNIVRTNGRVRIKSLGLDSGSVANRVLEVYRDFAK